MARRQAPVRCRATAGGFSLVELVIVVTIIGVISAIAVPRVTRAANRATVASLKADLKVVNASIQVYAAEHGGLSPAHTSSGLDKDGESFVLRMTTSTNEQGAFTKVWLGPYLREMPPNPLSGLATVRVDGPAAGAGTHGWRFDSTTWDFVADDSVASAKVRAGQLRSAFIEGGRLVGGTDASGNVKN